MTRRPLLLALLLLPALLAACSETLECPVGEVGCGGACVSLATDAANCGACGNACGLGFCSDGSCTCAPGTIACGGRCVDRESDPAACGSCEIACAAEQVCSLGACAAACAAGLTGCDRACVDLSADRYHCGSCGVACGPGQSCHGGTCRSVAVACLATDEVRTVSPDLAWSGPVHPAGDGPVSLALLGEQLFVANSLSHSLSAFPVGGGAARELLFPGGSDFENVVAHAGRLFVSGSGTGTLLVVDPGTGDVLDEIALGPTNANPLGVAFVEDRAYVALYGQSFLGENEPQVGQAIAVVDFAGVEGCTGAPCGTLLGEISVLAAADAPGYPFPSRAVSVGRKVYVTLANLRRGDWGYYTEPAGHGRLAVIDAERSDALSITDLGEGCQNPGGIALHGSTLWVSCGAFATQALLPVALGAGGEPTPGTPVPVAPIAPGRIAFCAGRGFVGDQYSGDLLAFDPADPDTRWGLTVCPLSQAGWALAADVACAP
ncbi:MAG TPA: MXAN_6577-like cysteine-rich protein [Anaeromyxobacteraceae bacterium]|nr:MXAN_6577-like cysteine-rich protein [Anaeromyxobacteraceae bacterium]